MRKVLRSSLVLFAASSGLVVASQNAVVGRDQPRDHMQLRQVIEFSTTTNSQSTNAAQSSAAHTSTTAAPTTQTSSAAAQTTSQQSSTQAASTAAATTTSAGPVTTSAPSAASTSAKNTVVDTTATDENGQLVTSVVTLTQSSAPSNTSPPTSNDSDSGGIGTGTIIGLSVAGGVAIIGIICFFVWKFTRKRFSDFDDNEAIKWPELNSHGADVHALPTNSTGRAGFGAENESDINLARAPSPGGNYAQSVGASSVGAGHDPYAVPPLPHLNPNQPYHDDPSAFGQSGYYDPYRGPVPNTFSDGLSDHGVEAIPMTQMARTRSPGPAIAYDMQGRASPGPQAGYGYGGMEDRARSPNPAALGGTRSPGPHAPYGYAP